MVDKRNDIFSWSIIVKTALLSAVLIFLFANQSALSSTQSASVILSQAEVKPVLSEEVINLPAKAYVIFDVKTGQILSSNNPDVVLPIASVTKLITAVTIMNNLPQTATTTITVEDVATEGGAGKLRTGEEYSYHELVFPLLLESSNDAAVAFERVTDGDLVNEMNVFTDSVGAQNTKFSDASGLSSLNVSTASDLALISSHIYKNKPEVFDVTRLSKYIGTYTGWINNNPVLSENYLGGKHGYTESALKTIVSIFEEDFGTEKKEIGYVVLGSTDLRADIKTLREFVAKGENIN